jgi:MFS transporter, MHS family, shikimate and dehydroshikimate transport protein
MFYASCVFAMAFAFPMFWLLDTRDPSTITLTIVAAITFGQMVGFAVGASWYSELFTARLRYSGASLGFQVGAAIAGLTPFAAAFLMTWTDGATWPISMYLMVVAAITLLAARLAPETASTKLTS